MCRRKIPTVPECADAECVQIPNVWIPNACVPECVPNVPRKIGGQSRTCGSRMYPNKKYADPRMYPNVNGGGPNVPECVDASFAVAFPAFLPNVNPTSRNVTAPQMRTA
eukprot:gene12525-biopygen12902